MAEKLAGKVLLKQDAFPQDLNKLCGGLAGDILIEDDPDAVGYYRAFASFQRISLSASARKKLIDALEKLTGVVWIADKSDVFKTCFTRKQLMAAIKTNPAQKELELKLKKTPLGKACDDWATLNAKLKKTQAELEAQGKRVLDELRKESQESVAIDGFTFIRKIVKESEQLVVKGK